MPLDNSSNWEGRPSTYLNRDPDGAPGIKELTSSGEPDRVTKVGALAPGFALKTLTVKWLSPQSSSNAAARRDFLSWSVVPVLHLDLKALQAALPDILSRGATLEAISPQNAANSRKSSASTISRFQF